MGNSSAFGSLARKALAWAIVAVVAILLFKFVVGGASPASCRCSSASSCWRSSSYAVIWAVRRL